jgi:hypothetical protein
MKSQSKLTRRAVVSVLAAAAPVAAQVTSPVPPKGVPEVPPSGSVADDLQKAVANVKQASDRLASLSVPTALEPAFAFRP